jgi:hypothetical protein
MTIRSFTGSDIALLMQYISGIKMMLPSAIKLPKNKRRSMFKLNAKKLDFVNTAIHLMKTQPGTIPPVVNVQECNNHLSLYHQYCELIDELDKIKTQMEDVKLQLGNELLMQTGLYYKQAAVAAQAGIEKFEAIKNTLKPLYAVGRNSKSAENVSL